MTLPIHLLGLAGLALLATTGVAPGQSQSVERHAPAAPVGASGHVTIAAEDYGSTDTTPLGVDLRGVRLIGLGEPVPARLAAGIDDGGLAGRTGAKVEAALAPFLRQPLSMAAIAGMQAALARAWREAGYPFMSVTVPPQEITSGVLVLRVVEFVAGSVAAEGSTSDNARLVGALRQKTGERIFADRLAEDLDWLNHNPFHHVEAQLSPGATEASSDILLAVSSRAPVSLELGWANSGAEATGRGRWSAEIGVSLAPLNGAWGSYRLTRGGPIAGLDDILMLDPARPGYLSHAGVVVVPTLPRQELSVAPSLVDSNEFVDGTPFSFANRMIEMPILYRSALSNIVPDSGDAGDVYFGIEPKRVSRTTRFGGVEIGSADAGLLNLVFGWSQAIVEPEARTTIDLRVKANVGSALAGNDAAAWSAFTGGRVTDPDYVYLGFDVVRTASLGDDIVLASQLIGLIAGQALPDTERLTLGGYHAVRGYDAGDASADLGAVLRNELHLPGFPLLGTAALADRLGSFAFVDLGVGYDYGTDVTTPLASAGLGITYGVGGSVEASLVGAVPLSDAGTTRAGDFSLVGSLRGTW